MKTYKKWIVGLDLSDFDEHLISYTHFLAQFLIPDEIYFIHIKKRIEIPNQYLAVKEKSRQELLGMVEDRVYMSFKDRSVIKCEVHEGTPEFDIWRESYLHHCDLIILGEKTVVDARKIVPEKLLRKSFCSVLFVPANTGPINHVWVPVDATENAKESVRIAMDLTAANKNSKITLHNIIDYPSTDVIKPELKTEYRNYFKKQTEEKIKEILSFIPKQVKYEIKFTERLYANVSDHIKEEAEAAKADFIIMSSGGKSRFSALFLGSATMDLVKLEKDIPLLIVKSKIDKVHAWDILTNL